MRLSRKGWNNVLIFSVLLIIFIFNFSPKLTLSSEVKQRTIINKALTIVEIKTPDYKITRFGQDWKSTPDLGLSKQQLALLVKNWQNLQLEVSPPASDISNPYTIQVYSADQEQPIIVQLFQYGDHYLLQTTPNASLFLQAQQLPTLLGR